MDVSRQSSGCAYKMGSASVIPDAKTLKTMLPRDAIKTAVSVLRARANIIASSQDALVVAGYRASWDEGVALAFAATLAVSEALERAERGLIDKLPIKGVNSLGEAIRSILITERVILEKSLGKEAVQ